MVGRTKGRHSEHAEGEAAARVGKARQSARVSPSSVYVSGLQIKDDSVSVYPPLKYLTGAKPNWLTPVDTPASEEEVEHAKQVRADFFRDTNRNPYMVDIVRAFRLAK